MALRAALPALSRRALRRASSQEASSRAEPEAGGAARLLDGRAAADHWLEELAAEAAEVRQRAGRAPGLGVVLVGDRPDSLLYVTRKREACERVGISERLVRLPGDCTQRQAQDVVRALCADPDVDGVLVQLPLPRQISEEAVMDAFDPGKDIDGFHPLNMGRVLMRDRARGFVPAAALGALRLLGDEGVPLRGRSAVVVGDSNTVGTPLAALLRDAGAASVTVVHRASYAALFQDADCDLAAAARAAAEACAPRVPLGPGAAARARAAEHGLAGVSDVARTADLLVVAVGYPRLVDAAWVKPGATVVDVGINVVDDRVVGDVDVDSVQGVAGALTPVPGGIGPMTIAATMHNVIRAARLRLLHEEEREAQRAG